MPIFDFLLYSRYFPIISRTVNFGMLSPSAQVIEIFYHGFPHLLNLIQHPFDYFVTYYIIHNFDSQSLSSFNDPDVLFLPCSPLCKFQSSPCSWLCLWTNSHFWSASKSPGSKPERRVLENVFTTPTCSSPSFPSASFYFVVPQSSSSSFDAAIKFQICSVLYIWAGVAISHRISFANVLLVVDI